MIVKRKRKITINDIEDCYHNYIYSIILCIGMNNYVTEMLNLPRGKMMTIEFRNIPDNLEEIHIGGTEKVFGNRVPAKRKVLERKDDLVAVAKFTPSYYLVELYRNVNGKYEFVKSIEPFKIGDTVEMNNPLWNARL